MLKRTCCNHCKKELDRTLYLQQPLQQIICFGDWESPLAQSMKLQKIIETVIYQHLTNIFVGSTTCNNLWSIHWFVVQNHSHKVYDLRHFSQFYSWLCTDGSKWKAKIAHQRDPQSFSTEVFHLHLPIKPSLWLVMSSCFRVFNVLVICYPGQMETKVVSTFHMLACRQTYFISLTSTCKL